MRHKYTTKGIVLSRTAHGEANLSLALLTEDLGLVRARAQGARKQGAKLAAALTTFAESEFLLVKGTEGWRVASASLLENRFLPMSPIARARAARVIGLLLRLAPSESADMRFRDTVLDFFGAISTAGEEKIQDAAECLAALKLMAALGLDAGEVPAGFDTPTLAEVAAGRRSYVERINRGLSASGL